MNWIYSSSINPRERGFETIKSTDNSSRPNSFSVLKDQVIQSEVIHQLLLDALKKGDACALATIAKVTGSAPREPGAKMVVYDDGRCVGTIGGGKFESLVIS